MAITRSTLVAAGTAPAASSDLWAPSAILRANWLREVAVASSYMTAIGRAESLAEIRRGRIDRPQRVVEAQFAAFGVDDLALLRSLLVRFARARTLAPLWSDRTRLTAAASAAATEIACDTRWRRLHVGGWIAIVEASRAERFHEAIQITYVSAVTDSTITTGDALTQDFPAGSFVYPLIESRLVLSSGFSLVSDRVAEGSIAFAEVEGKSALPSLVADEAIPAGWPTHSDGLPILLGHHDWNSSPSLGIDQPGDEDVIGSGVVQNILGVRPISSHQAHRARFFSREDAWSFLQFFSGRRGRLHPFWMVGMHDEHTLISVDSSTTITVRAIGELVDWDYRESVAFVMHDGTVQIRTVASVVRDEDEDAILLSAALSPVPSVAQVRRLCSASKARFASDELRERWTTDEVVDIDYSVAELLEEKSVTIADLASQANEDYTGSRSVDPEACCDPEIPPLPQKFYWDHGFDGAFLEGYEVDDEVTSAPDVGTNGLNSLTSEVGDGVGPLYRDGADGPNGKPYVHFEDFDNFDGGWLRKDAPVFTGSGQNLTHFVVVRRTMTGRSAIYGIWHIGCGTWRGAKSGLLFGDGETLIHSHTPFSACNPDGTIPYGIDSEHNVAVGQWAILALRHIEGGLSSAWKNGEKVDEVTYNGTIFSSYALGLAGWIGDGGGNPFDVAFAATWSVSLDDEEMADAFRHLNDKFGVY